MKITAVARRSGGWWAVHIPEVEGVFTQARRLDQVAAMAVDAVALVLGIEESSIEVEVEPHTDADSLIARAREARVRANQAAEEASESMRTAARELVGNGLTVRDAGRLLEVSPQRVSQLVS